MTEDDRPRHDLGALLHRLLGRVVERETPILAARGLTMWEYVILGALADAGVVSQTELARSSRRDATRLIAHLDALEQRGLVLREMDPADRRRRAVRLSDAGRALVEGTRRDIRAMEDEVLAALPPRERTEFRTALDRLAESSRGDG